ncbi:YggS family pyridoxal phosphate-dependent enzyme [Candidatus Peregrinibacteria bacterium]|nr:YggS family pyridoxal phosphate-dependent enzyme [Candidatus Peregrinibacteria bacterium]
MTTQIHNQLSLNERRQAIFQQCENIKICAVTKGRSIEEISSLLEDLPDLRIIGENRWPDCVNTFEAFKKHPETGHKLSHHFIGPLQSNKIRKVLPDVDCIQSIDILELLQKVSQISVEIAKPIDFLIQINISHDPKKTGIAPENLRQFIEHYLANFNITQVHLRGLMTIGAQTDQKERQKYFAELRKLFDQINSKYFKNEPLKTLSMGMSEDFKLAIKEGSTMVRLGSCLF